MAHTTQISAQVSPSAKQLLDEFSDATGIKKNRIVEDALWFYVRARQELPESAVIPARMLLSERGAATVEAALSESPRPTPALLRLMQEVEQGDEA